MPRPADAEPPHAVASLRGVPKFAWDDGGRGPFDDYLLGVRDPVLAALLADLAIACLAVDEPASVDRVPENRPHAALGPRRTARAAECGRRRDALPIELLRDRAHAEAASDVDLEDVLSNDGRLDRIDDQHDMLPARLPASGRKQCRRTVGALDRAAVAVGRTAAGPVPERCVCSMTAAHDLRELLGVLVGEDALQTLHQVAGHAGVVRAWVVSINNADAGPAERVLVKGRFLGVEPREAAHVVAENDIGRASLCLRTELEKSEELVASIGIEARGIVRKLSDDLVPVGAGPQANRRALLLD